MMPNPRRVAALSAMIAMSVVMSTVMSVSMSGCFASPTPVASPTPTGFASEEAAFAAAEATFDGYIAAVNEVALDEPETFEPVYGWTTGTAYENERKSLTNMNAEGKVVSGESIVASFEGIEQSLTTGRVSARVCLNVADVSLNLASGESAVAPDRPDLQTLIVDFVYAESTSTQLAIDAINGTDDSDLQCE